MRNLVRDFLNQDLSRRGFLKSMAAAGFTVAAAQSVLDNLVPAAHAHAYAACLPDACVVVLPGAGHCPWLETPDQAVVWGVALGLRRDVETVLDRTASDLAAGRADPSGLYMPAWYGPRGWSSGGSSGGGGTNDRAMSAFAWIASARSRCSRKRCSTSASN